MRLLHQSPPGKTVNRDALAAMVKTQRRQGVRAEGEVLTQRRPCERHSQAVGDSLAIGARFELLKRKAPDAGGAGEFDAQAARRDDEVPCAALVTMDRQAISSGEARS
jgi:hypothetical protein